LGKGSYYSNGNLYFEAIIARTEVTKMDELLTVPQVAKVLKTNTHAVYELIHQKKLKALQLGSWKVRLITLQIIL